MKRYRTALILFAVLFALGGLATWDEWKTKQEDEEKKTKNRLSEAKPEEVIEVDYASVGAVEADADAEAESAKPAAKASQPVKASLVKNGGSWRIVAPLDTPAEGGSVDTLVKTVLDYSYAKVVSEKKDQWKEYGLESPSRTITLKFAEASKRPPLTVYVGGKAPVGYSVYLRTNQADSVFMGSQHLLTSTSKSLFDLRDKSVAKIDEAPIKSLIYERRGEPTIELTKVDGKYKLIKPQELDTDSAEARDFVEEINSARAAAFIDAPDAGLVAAFGTPDYKLTWADDKGVSGSIAFLEKDGKLLAAFDAKQRVFQLGDDAKAKLKKEVLDFRNRRVLAFDSADASEVEIDGTLYKNVNGSWFKGDEAGKPEAKEVAHVRALLVDLEFAKTDRFFTAGEVADKLTKAAENKISIRFKKADAAPLTLELFATEDAPAKFLVRRAGVDAVYRMPKSAFNSMRPSDPAKAEGDAPGPADEMPDLQGFEGMGGASDDAPSDAPNG